jgi:hypothetical protein
VPPPSRGLRRALPTPPPLRGLPGEVLAATAHLLPPELLDAPPRQPQLDAAASAAICFGAPGQDQGQEAAGGAAGGAEGGEGSGAGPGADGATGSQPPASSADTLGGGDRGHTAAGGESGSAAALPPCLFPLDPTLPSPASRAGFNQAPAGSEGGRDRPAGKTKKNKADKKRAREAALAAARAAGDGGVEVAEGPSAGAAAGDCGVESDSGSGSDGEAGARAGEGGEAVPARGTGAAERVAAGGRRGCAVS